MSSPLPFSTPEDLCYNDLILEWHIAMRIAILGLGLIGGSLGLALSHVDPDMELVGYARRPEVAKRAIELGAVKRVESSAVAAVRGADVIVIATPVTAIKDIMSEIAESLSDGATVTDVASTKSEVLTWADEILPATVSFVGGHPMAGKELSGVGAAEGELFQGCIYCLVSGSKSTEGSIEALKTLVKSIGAKPLLIGASEHDDLVAGISHLPLLLSVALVSATTNSPLWPEMAKLASTGYRDLSRLASGDPRMGRDICMTNRGPIVRWLDEYTEALNKLRHLISDGSEEIETAFIDACQAREDWLQKYRQA